VNVRRGGGASTKRFEERRLACAEHDEVEREAHEDHRGHPARESLVREDPDVHRRHRDVLADHEECREPHLLKLLLTPAVVKIRRRERLLTVGEQR